MVGIGNCVFGIDTIKVTKGRFFSEEELIRCPLDKPIDGIYCIGKHDGDVTDLSICQWMSSRLASASKDGTVSTFFIMSNKGVILSGHHLFVHVLFFIGGSVNYYLFV